MDEYEGEAGAGWRDGRFTVFEELDWQARDISALVVPRVGCVTGDAELPWVVLDADDSRVESARAWLIDLHASDYPPATVRSYAYDLLSWHRFLWAVGVSWRQATRTEVRDWVRWQRQSPIAQRRRSTRDDKEAGRPAAGSVNAHTGKPYLAGGRTAATINHALSTVSGFYDYAVEVGLGPLVNPVPRSRADRERAFAQRSHEVPEHRGQRAPYRQKTQMRVPRQLPDELFSELFARLPRNRDRAIIATAVSSGARASELLSMRPVDVHVGEQTIDVIPKGGRHRTPVRASPDAFMWLTLHLAEYPPGSPGEALWKTRIGPPRPLSYWALRQILERANTALGGNITFHDLRHTYCYRLLQDPTMLITDVQELMRHKQLTTTQIYSRARMDDLIAKLQEHYARPPAPPPTPAGGYASADPTVLFPGAFP